MKPQPCTCARASRLGLPFGVADAIEVLSTDGLCVCTACQGLLRFVRETPDEARIVPVTSQDFEAVRSYLKETTT